MASFELDANLSPFKETSSGLSVQIIVHINLEVIHQFLPVIQGLKGLVHL